MSLFEKFSELTRNYDKAKYDLAVFISDNQKQILIDVSKELKEINGMNKVVIKGYTPCFNDGDACTHSSSVYFNQRYDFGELAEDDSISGLAEFLGAPEEFIYGEDDLYNWEDLNSVNTYSAEDQDKINSLVSMLDDLIERIYDTDYIVFIDLTTDEPTISYQSYDCGY